MLHGLATDFVEMHPGRIEIEIEMEIDIDVETPCEIEDARDLAVRIAVGIGTAADQVGAVFARFDQKLEGAGIVVETFLRKHADFDVDGPGIVALQLADGAKTLQADARIDFDMGAHPRRALHDRLLQRAPRPRVDVILGESELCGGDGFDRFPERAGPARAAIRDA